jgi:hypothetical protein
MVKTQVQKTAMAALALKSEDLTGKVFYLLSASS